MQDLLSHQNANGRRIQTVKMLAPTSRYREHRLAWLRRGEESVQKEISTYESAAKRFGQGEVILGSKSFIYLLELCLLCLRSSQSIDQDVSIHSSVVAA
jgi:hypothetical protein